MENLTKPSIVREILTRHRFSFSKGLGQNFIIDSTVCPKIAQMGNAQKGYGILEIGTGIGVLTCELAKRADQVVAIEIDSRLMPILDETLADYHNVKIINADVMKLNLGRIIRDEFKGLNVAVCANLPYYITSPIIMMLLEENLPIESITVMVQKEAARRLCAVVGTRETGSITVAVNYYGTVKRLFDVSRGSFMPSPSVDSSVIRIDLNNKNRLPRSEEHHFFRVVRGAFSQRRKTLANALASNTEIAKNDIVKALETLKLPINVRAECLAMQQFIDLARILPMLE